jgi:predicted dehydrogenase
MKSINRRDFLKSTSGILALAAMDLAGGRSASAQQQPSTQPTGEWLNVAVVGLGMKSGSHLRAFSAAKNCRITYVCDPDTATAKAAIDAARNSNGGTEPQFVQDMRRIMDDKSVDVVTIVTPNHWHSLAAVWAMQAGKDVYVEKPLSHNLREGRRVVEAATRTKRICEVGTQMRSNPALLDSMAYIHSGALGKVKIGRALCYKPRVSIGHVDAPVQPPSTVDYNLWCGPAPMSPLRRTKFHYDWHWQWDYGNGDIGNQGLHETDIALWAMDVKTLPRSAMSVGGRFGYIDDGQTANTQIAEYEFGEGQPKLIIEVRGLTTSPFRKMGVETVIHCENGYLVNPTYTSAIAYDRDGNVLKEFNGGNEALHFNNFIEVVRSRKTQDLHATVMNGHLAAGAVHLGNISYRLGKQTPLENAKEAFGSDADGNETMERMIKHLADNKIETAGTTFSLGRKIKFDPQTEKIIGDDEANKMLDGEYRAPFAMPT